MILAMHKAQNIPFWYILFDISINVLSFTKGVIFEPEKQSGQVFDQAFKTLRLRKRTLRLHKR